ncbi:MAG TPA: lipase family protein [Bryobacteraceae bacterium]|nr:lipase family protein [Bryobacteraceae bacterium]
MNPTVSTSLNFRLLCAAGSAYDIAPGGCAYTPDLVFSPRVAYTSAPKPVCGGFESINACLVGENADGIIVAFRGTLPPSLKDPESLVNWLEDFFEVPKSAPNVPGQVHSGFYDATMSIIAGVAAAVQNLNPGPAKKILVTGHSLGGALASIGAYILSQTYHLPISQVVTFASPKPGDPAFRTGYEGVINNQVRYENYDDVVPLLPPEALFIAPADGVLSLIPKAGKDLVDLFHRADGWNYVPVGSELFIEMDKHTIISNEQLGAQIWDVVKEFGEDTWERDFSSFVAAHTISPGGGYYRALSAMAAAAVP